MKHSFVAIAAALLFTTTGAALAHHSTAMFDLTRKVTVEGTVEAFEWTNPHTWLWLQVPKSGGETVRYGIEGMSPNFLSRNGWTRTALKPGDKVKVEINPLKDGQPGGFFVGVTLPDGKVMGIRGGPQ